MMNSGGIYLIRNNKNNKYYVGSTNHFNTRRKEHFNRLKNGTHVNLHLQSAYNKQNGGYFEFVIIEALSDLSKSNLYSVEQKYLDKGDKKEMYNKCYTADGGGADALRIPVYILNLENEIIHTCKSAVEAGRIIGYTSNPKINTTCVIYKKYRVVSIDFYNKHKSKILKWECKKPKTKPIKLRTIKKEKISTPNTSFKKALNNKLLSNKIILNINNGTVEFKDTDDLTNYLSLNSESLEAIKLLEEEFIKKLTKLCFYNNTHSHFEY